MKEHKKEENVKINIPAMVRDIAIHAISRGQIIPVAIFLIIIVIVFRLPPQILGEIVKDLFLKASRFYALGYVLSIFLILGWYIHVKFLNQIHEREMDRIAQEKTKLQKQLTPGNIQSSREV